MNTVQERVLESFTSYFTTDVTYVSMPRRLVTTWSNISAKVLVKCNGRLNRICKCNFELFNKPIDKK